MGEGLSWICPNCGYEFSAQLGFGFSYPWVCHQLIQKARAGAYGAEWQDLVETYPGTLSRRMRFTVKAKGIGTRISYASDGKEAEPFDTPGAEKRIELNGMKSELVIGREG